MGAGLESEFQKYSDLRGVLVVNGEPHSTLAGCPPTPPGRQAHFPSQ